MPKEARESGIGQQKEEVKTVGEGPQ